jgi:putative membrane protein
MEWVRATPSLNSVSRSQLISVSARGITTVLESRPNRLILIPDDPQRSPLILPLVLSMRRTEPLILLIVGVVCLALSAVGAAERGTWLLEVFPIFIAVPILIASARRFPLTPLSYRLIFVHALILMVGGHYTYAKVPLGFWMRDAFHLARNNYDRIGHFAQGFVPAMLAREILLRRTPLTRGKSLFFIVTCICLAISACYEFIEWGTAVVGGSSADAFLGTQGDVWDTQWDMFTALWGAIIAQLLLARVQDRELLSLAQQERSA